MVGLTRSHPDPHGKSAEPVLAFLRSEAGLAFEAMFWDFGSMMQGDASGFRTDDEMQIFDRGILVMTALCESTVLMTPNMGH